MAAALIATGIEPGDRVAIWAPNCWEWVVALLGLQSAGAALVPLNTRYKGVEAADILRRSRCPGPVHRRRVPRQRVRPMLREADGELLDSLARSW